MTDQNTSTTTSTTTAPTAEPAADPNAPSMLVLDAACDVSAWASTDVTRYNLLNACIDRARGVVVATNGHVLIKVPLPKSPKPDTLPPTPGSNALDGKATLLLPASALKAALKNRPKGHARAGQPPPVVAIGQAGVAEGHVNLTTWGTSGSPVTAQVRIEECQFPDYEHVIPTNPPRASVGISARYLEMVADYAKKASGDPNVGVILTIEDEQSPVCARVQVGQDDRREAMMVIMPMRMEGVKTAKDERADADIAMDAFSKVLANSTVNAEMLLLQLQAELRRTKTKEPVRMAV